MDERHALNSCDPTSGALALGRKSMQRFGVQLFAALIGREISRREAFLIVPFKWRQWAMGSNEPSRFN